jgi:hypothetical protein
MKSRYFNKSVMSWVFAAFCMMMNLQMNAQACDNVTDGGIVCCDQASNIIPFDPSPLTNVQHASGGSGVVEYLWLSTTNPYNTNFSSWTMIAGATSASYDPGPLSQTTFFVRCARRAACNDYVRESNVIVVTVSPCDNLTDAGKIASNQVACGSPFDPAQLNSINAATGGTGSGPVQYAWYKSTLGGVFSTTNGNWTLINGATGVNYDPTSVTQTTYYVRVARRSGCVTWLSSNVVSVTMKPGITASAMPVGATCFGYSDGRIMLTVNDGVPPFTYQWNYGQIPPNTKNPINLPAGSYSVTVTDANTCMAMLTTTVAAPGSLALSFMKTDVKCAGEANGTAVVQVAGGTPQYSYLWTNNMTAPQIGGLSAGRYFVTVTDTKGCQKVADVTVGEPTPLNIQTSSTDATCFGANSGSASVTASGGTAPYTYFWSNGQVTSSASGMAAGIYTVTVRDANNCVQVGSVTIKQPSLLNVSTTKTEVSCNGGNDGTITLAVGGGTPAYSYKWSNGATTQNQTGLTAGTYKVTVTDANGCSQVSVINLTQPTAIVLATNQVNAKCNGDKNASAGVVANGGSAPYSYIWSNGGATATLTGIGAGSYTVTVTDTKGCKKITTVVVTEPGKIVLTMTGSTLKCGGSNVGTASVVAVGGTSPYKYKWSNGYNSANLTGLVAGTYTVTVTDGAGCTAKGDAVVAEPTPIQITTVATDPKCYNSSTGGAETAVSGGTAPYTYLWSMGQTTSSITNMPAGTYTVTVTDANGCTKSTDVTLTNPTKIDVTATITNAKCNAENSGSIAASATGGSGTYTYKWSNSSTTATVTGLGAGNYTVTVTDSKGCTAVKTFEVKQPVKLVLEIAAQNIKCNGAKDGSIKMKIVGGTAPYTTIWSNGSTATTLTGLAAGVYNVTVTDANGCTEKGIAEILEPTALSLVTSTQDEKCYGQKNGAANVTPTGGTAPYSFRWSTGSTIAAISNLAPGTYTVTVSDKNNCTKVASVTINAATQMSAIDKVIDVKCFGESTGAASVIITGGAAPYIYQWSNGATTADLVNVPAGVYSVMVRDANGCMLNISVTIKQPNTALTVVTSHTATTCTASNGTATVTAAGGTAPYSYNWSNGGTTATISNLIAGNYTVVVTDANGCTKNATVQVTQPTPLFLSATQVDISCGGGNDGSASVTATGGSKPYTYLWSNGSTNQSAFNLVAGTYTVTVTDANGCKEMTSVTLSQPDPVIVTAAGSTLTCFGANDGSVTSSVVSGGTGPYTFKWSNGVAGANITGLLKAGTYTVTATDQRGCTGTATATVNSPTQVVITPATTPVRCKGGNDGTASISAVGGTGSYTYIWSNGSTSSSISGVGTDNYVVTVTDSNGCSASTIIRVNEPFGFSVSVAPQGVDCYNGNNGSAKVVISGAPVGVVAVKWSTGATTPVIGGLSAGSYYVTVTDQNGCTETAGFALTNPAKLEFAVVSTNVTCYGAANGTAGVTNISGGKAPYDFEWSNFRTTKDITNLTPGTYTVRVKDSNGCADFGSVIVTEPTPFICQANVTSDVTTYNGNQGSAVATGSGGTKPYSFKWSNGATTDAVNNLTTGTYSVTVTDANGCSCKSTITINNKSKIGNFVWEDLNGDGTQQAIEPGLANVTVTLMGTMTNGTPVTAVQVTDASGMYMFDGLMAGKYKVVFAHPNGYLPTIKNIGSDLDDSDVDPITKTTGFYDLVDGQSNQSVDAGYIKLVKLGDRVWFDKNKNGIQDANEAGFANIMVKLYKAGADNQFKTADDVLMQTTSTDNTGMYMFSDVMPGMKYQVEFMKSSIPAGYELTTRDAGANDAADSDADADGRSHIIMVMFNQANDPTIDAGLFVPCDNAVEGGYVGPKEQILCGPGIATTISSIDPASGGNSSPLEYLWLKSTSGPVYTPGSSAWTPIPGSNSPSYSPGQVFQSTWYVRCARRQGCDAYPAESNVVAVLVNAAPKAEIVTYPKVDACALQMIDFGAADAGAGATYSWNFGASAIAQFGTGKTFTIMYNAIGTKTIVLTVTKDGCTASTSVTVNVVLCPTSGQKVAITTLKTTPVDNNHVDVKWTTTNSSFDNIFIVERSKDGASFAQIATIEAKDFANAGIYTFVDQKPTIGHNVYRIKHVSFVGDLAYSPMDAVNILAAALKEVAVYPNPFTDRVNIELTRVTPAGAKIEVVNTYGQVVISEQIPGGQTRKEIDMSVLQSGFYIIKIDFDGQRTEVHKVTRQER